MSSATRRAARLADQLSRDVDVGVEVDWLCVRGEDCFVVRWRDGPDEASLHELAARKAGVAPTQVCCVRELTPLASACALLLWLLGHPDHLECVSALTLVAARGQVPYPERAPQAIVELARAVLTLSPSGRVDEETLTLLGRHAQQGWPALTTWLRTTGLASAGVIDLVAERRHRRSSARPDGRG